jgi:hypothetical protein
MITVIRVGMNQWEMELQFARDGAFDRLLLAGRYTLLDQTALREFLPYRVEHRVPCVIPNIADRYLDVALRMLPHLLQEICDDALQVVGRCPAPFLPCPAIV